MATELRNRIFQQFVRTEAAGGLVLLVAAVVALPGPKGIRWPCRPAAG